MFNFLLSAQMNETDFNALRKEYANEDDAYLHYWLTNESKDGDK